MFIQPNRTREKLRTGQPVYGVIATSGDAQQAELCAIAGFDYFMLDAEHGLVDPQQAVNVVRACERSGITPLVRIGPKDPKLVLQYLDAGMMGVMMPGLASAEEVRMLVEAVKYPPLGRRGFGVSRAAGYLAYGANAAEYIAFANRETLVITQFEDAALLDRLAEMNGVAGVDACMIGPRDLSLAMGHADGAAQADVQDVIDAVIARCGAAGVAVGITAASREQAEREVARGARMILVTAQALLLDAARRFLPARAD